MKKITRCSVFLLSGLMLAPALHAEVLIGWDDAADSGDNVPASEVNQHTYVSGVSGLVTGGRESETFQGSTDGTYGPLAGPPNPTAANGRFEIRGTGSNGEDDTLTIDITNTTGNDLELGALVFDFSRQFIGSPQGFDVIYKAFGSGNSLGISDVTLLSVSSLAETGANADLPDYSASIAALADNTLADGETALFQLIGRDATGTGVAIVDNIAFSGTATTGSGGSGTVPTAQFDNHATGAATNASLDAVTINGTWSLNTARGATITVEDSGGDKALLFDDTDGGNSNEVEFATLALDSAASFAAESVVFEFKTAVRRDFDDRGYVFVFTDSVGNEAGRLEWISDLGGAKNGVYLNGTPNTPASGTSLGTQTMTGLSAWDASSPNVVPLNVAFSNAQIHVDFGTATGSASVLNGATNIAAMKIFSNGSNDGNRGIFIDDINPLPVIPPVTESGPAPLIVWHSGSLSPDASTNVVASVLSIDGAGGTSGTHGSTDGSYGIYNTNAPVTGGAFGLLDGGALEISIVNNLSGRLVLEDIRLDFNRRSADAPTDVTVTYDSGDLDDTAITLGGLSNQIAITTDLADFRDLDLELRQKLFDTVLDEGESAVFRIAVSGASGSGTSYVDNIAIQASLTNYVAPVPAVLPMVSTVRKPNVVVFYADDLGIGDVSVSGYPTTEITTPNIDALAAQGMRFTDAHTAFATCAPSRYGILAGSMPFRGERFNGTFRLEQSSQFLAGQKSMGHLFQSAGYRTAHIGKTHLGGELYDSNANRVTGTSNLSSVDWLQGIADGPTGYLGFDYSFISHDGVQGPQYIYHENDFPVTGFAYDTNTLTWAWTSAATQPYVLLQAGSPSNPGTGDIDLDPDGNGALSDILFDSGSQFIYYGYGDFDTTKTGEIYMQAAKNFIDDHMTNHPGEPFYLHYACQAVHIPHTPDVTYFNDPVKMEEKTPHLDMVREMDIQLQMLIDHLEAAGVADDTIIIFTSDNGGLSKSFNVTNQNDPGDTVEHVGAGPFRGNKTTPWEGGTMVPFIVRWGDGTTNGSVIPPGTVCEQVFSQMDLYPTFATLLDLPQSPAQARDGYNVLPYFLGQTTTSLRDHLLAGASYLYEGSKSYRFSYRLGGWKIITSDITQSENNFSTKHSIVEMFHLTSDPYETVNLVDDPAYAEIKARMWTSLIDKVENSTRSTPALDADEDGLFDEWENSVAGNLTTYDGSLINSTVDTDLDGITDGDEYRLRSNPAVADAEIATLYGALAGSVLQLDWNTRPGRFYDLEKNTNLVEGTWNTLGTYPGNGAAHEVDVPVDTDAGFYRIVIEP